MTNLARLLEATALEYPNRTAIVSGDDRLTYAAIDEAANRVAHLLSSRGIGRGDTVALSCPNLPHFPAVYYGILKSGAAVVPLSTLLKPHEVQYHLADSDATAFFAFAGTPKLPIGDTARKAFAAADSCRQLFIMGASPSENFDDGVESYESAVATQPATPPGIDADDEDTAVILYTSGTTGRPKGAELRHRNLRDNALTQMKFIQADKQNPDVFLSTLPLFHSFGQTVILNGGFAFGGTIVMMERFDAATAISLIVQESVTYFAGVPTMYWSLLDALAGPDEVQRVAKTLRAAVAGGSPMPIELHRRFQERFGFPVSEGYGLSEASPGVASMPWGDPPRFGSIGKPLPGVEMKLIGDDWREVPDAPSTIGEIAVRGHNVMKGYYRRPEATREAIRDGWLRTGDLARRDAEGYYFIVDRSKDVIIRNGYNVYPREIEELLVTHPAVALAAVIGVPHPTRGEDVKAVIVPERGSTTTEDEIAEWCKENLASYKYPRIVEFRDALPMTSTGKILKREIT